MSTSLSYAGGNSVFGYIAYENFYLNQNGTLNLTQFPYIQVIDQFDTGQYAGLIGLARGDFNES